MKVSESEGVGSVPDPDVWLCLPSHRDWLCLIYVALSCYFGVTSSGRNAVFTVADILGSKPDREIRSEISLGRELGL